MEAAYGVQGAQEFVMGEDGTKENIVLKTSGRVEEPKGGEAEGKCKLGREEVKELVGAVERLIEVQVRTWLRRWGYPLGD